MRLAEKERGCTFWLHVHGVLSLAHFTIAARVADGNFTPVTDATKSWEGGFREWLWPVALALMIFFASGRSQVAAPRIPGIDKVAHFFAYGLLGTLLARVPAIARLRPLGIYSAVLIASLYGMTDEFHQSFIPGRDVEIADWIMDTAGALLAVTLYARWTHYRRVLESPVSRQARMDAAASAASEP